MIIDGTHRVEGVLADAVFDAMADASILARTLPGCRSLVDLGDGAYEVSIDVGVASVRGSYSGQVRIRESYRPEFYEATLQAGGAQGSVTASMRAQLASVAEGTDIAYRLDARVAGRIAGVGQRVIAGVSRRNAVAFFNALERELTQPPDAAPAPGLYPASLQPPPDAVAKAGSRRTAIRWSAGGAALALALALLVSRAARRGGTR